jgi:anti-sigma regulatory factor (Ser/Thr protein kinase)
VRVRAGRRGEEIRLSLDSRIEYIDAVHRLAEEVGRAGGLARNEAFELGLAVREAYANAVTHGNERDPTKRVRLGFKLEPIGVRAWVEDEGGGFNPRLAPDPLAPENLTATQGRGFFMIKAYTDGVEVRRGAGGGSRLCMLKRVGSRRVRAGRALRRRS